MFTYKLEDDIFPCDIGEKNAEKVLNLSEFGMKEALSSEIPLAYLIYQVNNNDYKVSIKIQNNITHLDMKYMSGNNCFKIDGQHELKTQQVIPETVTSISALMGILERNKFQIKRQKKYFIFDFDQTVIKTNLHNKINEYLETMKNTSNKPISNEEIYNAVVQESESEYDPIKGKGENSNWNYIFKFLIKRKIPVAIATFCDYPEIIKLYLEKKIGLSSDEILDIKIVSKERPKDCVNKNNMIQEIVESWDENYKSEKSNFCWNQQLVVFVDDNIDFIIAAKNELGCKSLWANPEGKHLDSLVSILNWNFSDPETSFFKKQNEKVPDVAIVNSSPHHKEENKETRKKLVTDFDMKIIKNAMGLGNPNTLFYNEEQGINDEKYTETVSYPKNLVLKHEDITDILDNVCSDQNRFAFEKLSQCQSLKRDEKARNALLQMVADETNRGGDVAYLIITHPEFSSFTIGFKAHFVDILKKFQDPRYYSFYCELFDDKSTLSNNF